MTNIVKRHAKKDQVTIHPNKSDIVLLNGHKSISKNHLRMNLIENLYHSQQIPCI